MPVFADCVNDGDCVVGVDAGGTHTGCVVVDLNGTVLARATTGGGNLATSAYPRQQLVGALQRALDGIDVRRVRAGVFGLAGIASTPGAEAMVRGLWAQLGLEGDLRVCDDIVIAFASGTARPRGTVLIAGTGAVAAHVSDGRVTRRCDGNGWLLGDEGSAVWIAVAALRAVLAAHDGRGRPTALTELIAEGLGVPTGDPRPLRGAVYARGPAELGVLAPLVCTAAGEGDAVARRIVADAAERLLASLASLGPDPAEPLVLAGSVLRSGPVADAVWRDLDPRLREATARAGDGALGAARMALRGLRARTPAAAVPAVH